MKDPDSLRLISGRSAGSNIIFSGHNQHNPAPPQHYSPHPRRRHDCQAQLVRRHCQFDLFLALSLLQSFKNFHTARTSLLIGAPSALCLLDTMADKRQLSDESAEEGSSPGKYDLKP